MFFLDGKFLKAATERAVKSGFQFAGLAYFGGDVLFDVFTADWKTIAGVFAGGVLTSYVTSFGSGYVGERETPSVTGETLAEPREPYVPLSDDDLGA